VYGCTVSFYRGRSVCANRAFLPLRATETALLDTIAAQVLHPEIIRRALRLAEAQLTTPASVDRKVLRDELHRVEEQLGNLRAAV
jgi:hypothetical protein